MSECNDEPLPFSRLRKVRTLMPARPARVAWSRFLCMRKVFKFSPIAVSISVQVRCCILLKDITPLSLKDKQQAKLRLLSVSMHSNRSKVAGNWISISSTSFPASAAFTNPPVIDETQSAPATESSYASLISPQCSPFPGIGLRTQRLFPLSFIAPQSRLLSNSHFLFSLMQPIGHDKR